jgi:hypothetical protein
MEPYDLGCNPGELGGVGEGVRSSDGAVPLTAATSDQRSQVSLPLPKGRGGMCAVPLTQLRVSSKLLTPYNPLQITAKHLL